MNSLIVKSEIGKGQLPFQIFLDAKEYPEIFSHLETQIKIEIGKSLKFTLLELGVFLGKILSFEQCPQTSKLLSFSVEIYENISKIENWIDVAIGFSRPQTVKKIFEHGSTLGVKTFHFFPPKLYEKSFETAKVFSPHEFDHLCSLGLSQSAKYFQKPHLKLWQYSLEHFLKENSHLYEFKFALHPKSSQTFLNIFHHTPEFLSSKKILLIFGPERGFTDAEYDLLTQYGFTNITLSKAILRVEHALFASLHQLEMLQMYSLTTKEIAHVTPT